MRSEAAIVLDPRHRGEATQGWTEETEAGVQVAVFDTARHWGGTRHGHPQEFQRWVPLMLEMMAPSVSRKPPSEAVRRPRARSRRKALSWLAIIVELLPGHRDLRHIPAPPSAPPRQPTPDQPIPSASRASSAAHHR